MNTVKNALLGLCVMAVTIGCATLTNAAQQGPSPKVQYYPHEQVATAFGKGETLTQGKSGQGIYRVLTARRDGPGEVEIHKLDTDVLYVIKGSSTFVTGGKVVDAKKTVPNEERGKSIQGGTTRHLGEGDMLIIPHGIPHWFEAVQPPFLYLVVKVR